MLVGLVLGAFALAGTRVARADFAPPPLAGEQRPLTAAAPGGAVPAPPAETNVASQQPATDSAARADTTAAAAPAALPEQPAAEAPAPAAAVSSPAPRPPAVAEIDDEDSLRAFRDENAPPRSRLNVAAWIGTGVTVALLGVAAFYGAKAGEKASDVDRLSHNFDSATDLPVEYATVADQYTAAMRDGKHDARVAKGFLIAAGATALTSAALFIIDGVRKPAEGGGARNQALLTPLVTAQGAGLGLGGTF